MKVLGYKDDLIISIKKINLVEEYRINCNWRKSVDEEDSY